MVFLCEGALELGSFGAACVLGVCLSFNFCDFGAFISFNFCEEGAALGFFAKGFSEGCFAGVFGGRLGDVRFYACDGVGLFCSLLFRGVRRPCQRAVLLDFSRSGVLLGRSLGGSERWSLVRDRLPMPPFQHM